MPKFLNPITITTPGASAPLIVNSSTLVSNLNADLLDGQHGSYYENRDATALGFSGGVLTITRAAGNLTANLDGRYLLLSGGTVTGATTFSADVSLTSKVSFGNRQPIYTIFHGGAQDLAWKKIADVTFGTGLYRCATFKIDVVDNQSNFGYNSACFPMTYFVSCRRSGGVQDDYNDATVFGPVADYVRVVKTATGVYEIQIRQIADWLTHIFTVENTINGAGTITYATGTPGNGSTTGTIYTATAGWTQRIPNLSITSAATVGGTLVVTGVATFASAATFSAASGTYINTGGGSDAFGYNATAGYGHYIKGTGNTYIYGGGVFWDGSAIRTLLHSNNFSSYALPISGGTLTGKLSINSTGAWNDAQALLTVGSGGDGRIQVRHIWGKSAANNNADHLWLNYQNANGHVQIGDSGGGNNLYVSGQLYAGGYFGGSLVLHAGNYTSYAPSINGGSTIAGITYFSNGESMNVYGIRGRFTNEYLHLYNKVGVGHPGGWGQGETSTPDKGLSTYGGINVAYGNSATSSFAGQLNANGGLSLGGPLYYSAYTRRQISLAGPSTANFGPWKQFIRLWAATGSGANLFTLKVSARGSWNWTPVFGTVEAYYSLHLPGDGTINTLRDFRITHVSGPATDNVRLGDAVIENGYISIPVWGANTNVIEATVEQWNGSQILGSTTTAVSEALPAFIAPNFRGGLTSDGNAVLHAGNYGSYALPLSGGTLTGNLALNTGVIFNRGSAPSITNIQCSIFNELNGIGSAESLNFRAYAGFKWQYWDGSATWMQLTSSGLTINGNNTLHAGNYTSYALPISGGAVTGGLGVSGSYTAYNGQALTLGSDASNAYIQSWGSRTLSINPQGNPITFGGNVTVYGSGAFTGQVILSATTDPAILLSGGASADGTTHLYTSIGGVGKVRIQRNGIIAALGLSIKSGTDVNGATEVFSVSNAGAVTASSFSGAGTGLTGTAASLSIGGTAATATTANSLNTANNYQVNSIGVGIAANGTAGAIRQNENGVRSWTITPSGGNLNFASGDGSGAANFSVALQQGGQQVLHAGNYRSTYLTPSVQYTTVADASGYTWIRIPYASGGESFNNGQRQVEFYVTRSIFDNSSTPYSGCTAKFVFQSREWHSGQEMMTVQYGEHGGLASFGAAYFISHARVADQAGSGYWIYLRLKTNTTGTGITYSFIESNVGGIGLNINDIQSTTDPGSGTALYYGFNLISTGSQARFYRNANEVLDAGNVGTYALPIGGGTLAGNLTINGNLTSGSGYQLRWSDGSAASPGYSFFADTDTGIHRSADNTLALVTGGTIRATVNSSGNLGVNVASALYRLQTDTAALFNRTAFGVLDINSNGSPNFIKIQTAIPFSYGSQAYTVNIRGFTYDGSQTVDITVCWHQYLDTFYNPTVSSSGSFAPTVRLARENSNVVICLTWGAKYWPKLYVESVHNFDLQSYSTGWSWSDADITGDKVVTLSYKNDWGGGMSKDSSGNLTVTGNITANGIVLNRERNQNARIYSATTGAMGLLGVDSAAAFRWQIYGESGNYGFLDSTWGNWDIKKGVNDQLDIRVSGSLVRVLNAGNYQNYALPLAGGTMTGQITGAYGPTVSFYGNACDAGSYNYVLGGANDGGNKLVVFVNGSTRTADGGVNAVTIRNDGGPLNLGLSSYVTNIYGSSVAVSGALTQGGNQVLHAGNYTNYTPNSIVYPFLNTSLNLNTTGGTNEFTAFNSYYPSGGSYNQPVGGAQHFKILQFGRYNSSDTNYWRGQIAMSFYEDRMWFRKEYSQTWGGWQELLHTGNYSSYALPLSGGTLTGALSGTSASFSGALSSGGNSVLTVGNYSSYAVDNTKRVKQFFWDTISASTTQARRFEIARIAIDIVNWNQVGTFEIELSEQYWSNGLKKKYVVSYGYNSPRAVLKLVEMSGAGTNNFQVVLGSEQPVSGNHYYLPVYVDVRYYTYVDVRVTTSRQITANSTPPVGYAYINSSPTPTNITDFTADSTVDLSNAASAWQVGGNTIIHSGNYTSYPPARWATGRSISLTGDVTGTSGLFDGTANLSFAATLSNSGVTAGTYRSVTVDAKGRVTGGTNPTTIAGYGITDALSTTGATMTGALNVTGVDQGLAIQHNGNTAAWFGRIITKNSTSDRAAFLGTYGTVAGVFAHNNALNAWADIYINTVDGSTGGVVRMPSTVYVNGNQVIHTGNYVSYSPSLTGGGASGTWGINISGSSASCSGNAATATNASQLNGQAGSYYENRSPTAVSISAGTLTITRAAGNLTTTIGGRVVAWCDFNGNFASTQTPNANFNVSSITKNATGDYTVNFSSALANANYVVAGTAQLDTPSPGQSNYNVMVAVPRRSGAKATGSCRIVCEYPAGVALYDSISVGVAFIAA